MQRFGIASREGRLWIYFSICFSVLMKKQWVGNRRKSFYGEMWGNAIWGGRACENLVRLSIQDGPILANIWWSWRRLEDISSRRPEDMSSRYLQDVLETKKCGYLYLKILNGYVSNKPIIHKSITDESKVNSKSSIRTQWFQYSSYFKTQAAFLFWELKSLMTVWCCEISWIQIRHYRTGEAIKTKF